MRGSRGLLSSREKCNCWVQVQVAWFPSDHLHMRPLITNTNYLPDPTQSIWFFPSKLIALITFGTPIATIFWLSSFLSIFAYVFLPSFFLPLLPPIRHHRTKYNQSIFQIDQNAFSLCLQPYFFGKCIAQNQYHQMNI